MLSDCPGYACLCDFDSLAEVLHPSDQLLRIIAVAEAMNARSFFFDSLRCIELCPSMLCSLEVSACVQQTSGTNTIVDSLPLARRGNDPPPMASSSIRRRFPAEPAKIA